MAPWIKKSLLQPGGAIYFDGYFRLFILNYEREYTSIYSTGGEPLRMAHQ